MSEARTRTIILGAAGRDFHNFNMLFRDDPATEVVAFTAQQIPHIADRRYPAELSGPFHPDGVPIHDEAELESLVAGLGATRCVMAYSDVSHEAVMHLASRANAAGADFLLVAAARTMLRPRLPAVAVCATRTGAGKSQTSRAIANHLRHAGLRVGVIRHPMPYGELAAQRVQRFATKDDLARHRVTIEEREEFEPHMAAGSIVYAGVDYAAILQEVEREADVLLWDGGNNDTPFLAPTLHFTVADPHRAGHELRYYPGETNVRLADIVIVNKVDTAAAESVAVVETNVRSLNPRATIVRAASPPVADDAAILQGRRVLAIEDGPTVTHGEMPYGAATIAALRAGASLVDPRPFAVGEIADTFERYPGLGALLPAMGYGDAQVGDLEETLARAADHGVEAIAIGTPIDLAALVRVPLPHTRVRYELVLLDGVSLTDLLAPVVEAARRGPAR